MIHAIGAKRSASVTMDESGNITAIGHGDSAINLPLGRTHFEMDETPVALRADGSLYRVNEAQTGRECPALIVAPGEELVLEPEGTQAHASGGITSWSMTLALPLETEFHIPEYINIGRKLDARIPVADFYETTAFYNFCIAGCNGVWLRFLSEQRRFGRMGVLIERHDKMFLLTVTWRSSRDDAGGVDPHASTLRGRLAIYGSLEDALSGYQRYLNEEVGINGHLQAHPHPEWVNEVPLSISVDMIRSYGEVVHTYPDVAEISRALRKAGAPENTIIHIVGFNGPFDTTYPTYRPVDELGGASAFDEMVDVVHGCGYRLSVHVNGCCIDPSHPNIDDLMPMVLRDQNGDIQGYKIAPDKTPPSRRIRFSTERVTPTATAATSASLQVDCPVLCESMMTLGGLDGVRERVTITINGRSHRTPAGANLERYHLPYPMHLAPGTNTVELSSDTQMDWSRAWFSVDTCFVPNFVHAISTIPILMADTTNDDFISLFCDEVAPLVTVHGVDLLYIDYTNFYHPNGSQKLFAALRERLPGTPFAIEWGSTLEELGWFAFTGGSRHHLVKGSPKLQEIAGRKQVPVTRGIVERYDWLDQPSPVCDFVSRYTRARGGGCFVPRNWVASLYPNHLIYGDPTELREVLDEAKRLNFVPSISLNYAHYGIDEHALEFIQSLSGSTV